MPIHFVRTLQSLSLIAVVIASQSTASAEEPSPSMAEKKLRMLEGTSTGIVIFDFKKTPQSPASATAKSEAQSKPSAESAPQAPDRSGFLSALPPPDGRSLNDLRRFGTADGGVVVPTAPTPMKPHADPSARP
ncbi:MAG: hypothetical protein WCH60_03875 [Burkholderiales bacterium]